MQSVIRLAAGLILLLVVPASAQIGKHRALFTPASPAIFVQGSAARCAHVFDGATSYSCTPFLANVTAGDRLVLAVFNFTSAAIVAPVVTDNQGNTYTQLGATGLNATSNNSELFVITTVASSTGAITFTFNWTNTGNFNAAIAEYSPSTVEVCPAACSFTNINFGDVGANSTITTSFTSTLVQLYGITQPGGLGVAPAGFTNRVLSVSTAGDADINDKSSVASGAQTVAALTTGHAPLHIGLIALH